MNSKNELIKNSSNEIEEQMELLLKVMDDVTICDGEGKLIRVNSSFENLYHINKEDIIGKSVYELEKTGIFSPSISIQVLNKKKKITILQKNKKGEDILTTGVPVMNDDGEVKYVISYETIDISEHTNLKEKYGKLKEIMNKYYYELNKIKLEEMKFTGIISKSKAMEDIFFTINNTSDVTANVLITGETGVGKNLIGKLIHDKSSRSNEKFVEVNCGAIPENLLESELFGYEKGAFTGASEKGKKGIVQEADKGTLFLDEIGELDLNMQKKILHVIQEKRIIKVGGNDYINVDFRLIAATNKDLKKLVDEGKFRRDLYYRLNVLTVHIPSLRDRKEDIVPLILHFLEKNNQKYHKNKKISQKALDKLVEYEWPGNVRELENIIERTVITTHEDEIDLFNLPEYIVNISSEYNENSTLKDMIENFERNIILTAYNKYKTTVKMSENLGISQSSAVRKLQKYLDGYK